MEDRSAMINGLTVDENTGDIRIGRGASGWFTNVLNGIESGAIDTDNDVVLFCVSCEYSGINMCGFVNGAFTGHTFGNMTGEIIRKVFQIGVSDDEKYECVISLTHADTKKIAAGEYTWNGIIVTDPDYDDDGNIIVDEDSQVVPFFTNGERPKFTVEEVGCVV